MKAMKLILAGMLLVGLGIAGPASAQIVAEGHNHGILLSKGCVSPLEIGDEYVTNFTIGNFNVPGGDESQDTLRVTSLVDVLHSHGAAGDISSGNILNDLTWTLAGGAFWDGSTLVLPTGASAASSPWTFQDTSDVVYHVLTEDVVAGFLDDDVTIVWWDVCDGPGSNDCPRDENYSSTGASAEVDAPPPCLEISKSVNCEVSVPGNTVTYHYCIENCGDIPLEIESVVDSVVPSVADAFVAQDCGTLDPGEECCFDVDYVIPEDAADPLVNEFTVTAHDTTYDQDVSAGPVSATVDLVHPALTLEKSCTSPDPVEPGGVAFFRITVTNSGDVDLLVDVTDIEDSSCDITDLSLAAGGDAFCDVGITVPADFTGPEFINHVTASWSIADGGDCLPNTGTVNDEEPCPVAGTATRTPGFWKTHYNFASHVLDVHIPGCGDADGDDCIDLGWIKCCTMDQVCAVFWANKANNSNGTKRTALGQARMHASFQALAAIFNNCVPSGGRIPVDPTEIASILGGTDIEAIKALASTLSEYNESGDDVALVDPDAEPGRATPGECKSVDVSFADSAAAVKPGKP